MQKLDADVHGKISGIAPLPLTSNLWNWYVPKLHWDAHGYLTGIDLGDLKYHYGMIKTLTQMFMDVNWSWFIWSYCNTATLIWLVMKASCLLNYYSIKCKASSVKHKYYPLSKVLLPYFYHGFKFVNWKFINILNLLLDLSEIMNK